MTIVGCGYVGRRIVARCRAKGGDVIALVHTGASRRRLEADGVRVQRIDLDESVAGGLPAAWIAGRDLIYMVPPPRVGSSDTRMARFLAAVRAEPRRLVYLSTSAVYGDRGGARVDEDTPPDPSSDRGRRRLDAEEQLRSWGRARGIAVRVLRVPGIYGPGRLPLARLRQGGPVLAPDPDRPGNRIHVDDLATACCAACRYEGALEVFNVGDGDHTDSGSFMQIVAREAGLPPPATRPLKDMLATASPMGREFLQESRRLDVTRMRETLGVQPRFADPLEGIRASLDETCAESP